MRLFKPPEIDHSERVGERVCTLYTVYGDCVLLVIRPAHLPDRDPPKGVGPGPTLAWPGWKQPDIQVEVDTDRLETSCSEAGVLKKLTLAGIAKLSRLKYR